MDQRKKEEALHYHEFPQPGKIAIVPTKKHSTQHDLALAYSPGVAEPCLAIAEDKSNAYKYTAKSNLVAVISNGTAVLGLGDIGADASKPVMEGKGLLFKIFAGIDVFDIEIDATDVDKFIETVKAIAPTFGGINLEDIKAPEAFEIERRLKEELIRDFSINTLSGSIILEELGELNDPMPMSVELRNNKNQRMSFDAYSYDEADNALVLISSVFYNERDSKPNLAEGGVNDILGYMQNFISEVNKGNISKYCDESDDVIQVAKEIKGKMGKGMITTEILRFKLYAK